MARPAPRSRSLDRLRDLADRLLVWVTLPSLAVAVAGLGLGLGVDAIAAFTGDGSAEMFWNRAGQLAGTPPTTLRLALAALAHGLVTAPLTLRALQRLARLALSAGPRLRWGIRAAAALTLGGLWAQPTLVTPRLDAATLQARTANLLDGTAARHVSGTIAQLARRVGPRRDPGSWGVGAAGVNAGLDSPTMRRWDPILREVTRDREHFAKTKAVLWVESAGRQFAVSRTGCAGLMQFCVSTAQRRPFRQIFGVGAVSPCRCGAGGCAVPRSLAREAEATGAVPADRGFPCDPRDARFNPRRALAAGAAFVDELGEAVDDELLLIYVGYNSGPAVARKVHAALGGRRPVDVEALRPHLATALARWYGRAATPRANGLLDVHLPKLQRAYEHYRR